jgi:hypothetical protein
MKLRTLGTRGRTDRWAADSFAEMIPLYKPHPEVLIGNASRAMDAILGR